MIEKGTRKEAGCHRNEDVELNVLGDEVGQDMKLPDRRYSEGGGGVAKAQKRLQWFGHVRRRRGRLRGCESDEDGRAGQMWARKT